MTRSSRGASDRSMQGQVRLSRPTALITAMLLALPVAPQAAVKGRRQAGTYRLLPPRVGQVGKTVGERDGRLAHAGPPHQSVRGLLTCPIPCK
jgi:hypothetical protein